MLSGTKGLKNKFNREFVSLAIFIKIQFRSNVFHQVNILVFSSRYKNNVERIKFINKLPYLMLVPLKVMGIAVYSIVYIFNTISKSPYTFKGLTFISTAL